MQRSNGIAWTALIIGIIALILGWVAFNRSGEDVNQVVQREVDEAVAELRVDLEALREQIRQDDTDDTNDTTTE